MTEGPLKSIFNAVVATRRPVLGGYLGHYFKPLTGASLSDFRNELHKALNHPLIPKSSLVHKFLLEASSTLERYDSTKTLTRDYPQILSVMQARLYKDLFSCLSSKGCSPN